jgi:NAD(P)-dependent dehydrogenase (short-subunit alcohol dehydrogenase family)
VNPSSTAVVTGGASGIGRALSEALAAGGTSVVLADRQLEVAEEAAAAIRARGASAQAVELDVRDADRFRAVVQDAVARTGRLDYLFNNAGIAVAGEASDYERSDWDDVIDVNLRGVAYGILAAYPVMIRQGFGHIVNTASMAGLTPVPIQLSYAATKHAVVGLSRSLRMEARRHGVKVSVLCPGPIRTPILEGGRYGRWKASLDRGVIAASIERLRPMDPTRFAERVLRAVAENRAVIIEPNRWRVVWWISRISPSLFERAADRVYARLLRELEARGQDAGGDVPGSAAR